jgi:hypothetical protein
MFRLPRKFVAVLLAVWLPFFGGNALAASIVMQSMNGDCHGAQQVSHPSQHVSASLQHMHHAQLAANGDQSAGQHDSQSSTCNNCGVCQLACSGYLAAVTIDVAEAQPSSQSFTLSSAQFQSYTSAPLDPPPLARV